MLWNSQVEAWNGPDVMGLPTGHSCLLESVCLSVCLSVCQPASIQEWAIAADTRAEKGSQLSFEFQTEIGELGHLLHTRLNLPLNSSPRLCGGGEVRSACKATFDLQLSRVPAFKLQLLRALPAFPGTNSYLWELVTGFGGHRPSFPEKMWPPS